MSPKKLPYLFPPARAFRRHADLLLCIVISSTDCLLPAGQTIVWVSWFFQKNLSTILSTRPQSCATQQKIISARLSIHLMNCVVMHLLASVSLKHSRHVLHASPCAGDFRLIPFETPPAGLWEMTECVNHFPVSCCSSASGSGGRRLVQVCLCSLGVQHLSRLQTVVPSSTPGSPSGSHTSLLPHVCSVLHDAMEQISDIFESVPSFLLQRSSPSLDIWGFTQIRI